MAGYFEEMGWTPLGEGEAPDQFLHMARLVRDLGIFETVVDTHELPPPVSKEYLKNLKRETLQKSGGDCTICLKTCIEGEEILILGCKHKFHSNCILPWLERTSTCPMCRYEMPTDDEDYENSRKQKLRQRERQIDIENLHNSMFS